MTVTAIVIWAIIGFALVYDMFALKKSYTSTISWTIFAASRRWPILPFFGGLLVGHLWFSITGPDGRLIPMPPETNPCGEQSK